MKADYIKWFDMEFSHSYFEKNAFSSFELVPFDESAKAMKNYQIMKSKNENQMSFFINAGSDTIKDQVDGLDNLYFQLIIEDALFFNYTNLPFLNEGQRYYFQNQLTDALQPNAFVSPSDLLSNQKKTFNLSLSKKETSIEIKSLEGHSVHTTSSNGVVNFPLNLSSLEDGAYQLWIDNQMSNTIFISDEEFDDNCVGIIKLNINEMMSNYSAPKKLKLSFNARSAYFEYQVVVPTKRKIEVKEMNIVSADEELFNGPKEQLIIGNQPAKIFTSKRSFQLQHKTKASPKLNLMYANKFSNRNNHLEKELPYPEIDGLKKYNAGNGHDDYLLITIVYV